MVVNTQFHQFYGRSFARVLYFILMKDCIHSYDTRTIRIRGLFDESVRQQQHHTSKKQPHKLAALLIVLDIVSKDESFGIIVRLR